MSTDEESIVIPLEVIRSTGLRRIENFEQLINSTQLRKLPKPGRGQQLIEELRGKAPFPQTTDEILRLTRGDD
ncbi:hypothetical protein LEP3755_01410 [Leptolyngbya sp. NIES-3755]|nr:hypothetical protein LEP3755_01410 [Leptolyngbya sp. NIES-3755]